MINSGNHKVGRTSKFPRIAYTLLRGSRRGKWAGPRDCVCNPKRRLRARAVTSKDDEKDGTWRRRRVFQRAGCTFGTSTREWNTGPLCSPSATHYFLLMKERRGRNSYLPKSATYEAKECFAFKGEGDRRRMNLAAEYTLSLSIRHGRGETRNRKTE